MTDSALPKRPIPPILAFVGWHNSGKTTLVCAVVAEIKRLGYRVAVVKSSSKTGVVFDSPGTDTSRHKAAGADMVMLVAPDQMCLQTRTVDISLKVLVERYLCDVDIVIAEGFKRSEDIAKIEVFVDRDQRLRDQVSGVIAVATNCDCSSDLPVFRLDQAAAIAGFLEQRFLHRN
ncbi:MAG: molybdopterin-guanine dinucleotide biosynthesis protein B [Deltaproteobacteria bacterium]|nr:MAG: molybdopterin-guanine dinucleotide biosynthesis protein B [Deltaproteobacteria bacterium]